PCFLTTLFLLVLPYFIGKCFINLGVSFIKRPIGIMMKTDFIPVLIASVSLLVGYGIGYVIRKLHWEIQAENAGND
ncbi:hypothetical protein, partial [Lactobacillus jensenii]|uniref:hypothetical protein n=1 Tax=Lactobacillus jensenii TaxID=109790 RepID=UPI00286FE13A